MTTSIVSQCTVMPTRRGLTGCERACRDAETWSEIEVSWCDSDAEIWSDRRWGDTPKIDAGETSE